MSRCQARDHAGWIRVGRLVPDEVSVHSIAHPLVVQIHHVAGDALGAQA
jgi:hypothetical protein